MNYVFLKYQSNVFKKTATILKTHVLHIIDSLGIGGAEKLLVCAVNNLSGFQHHVIYLHGPDSLAVELPPDCRIKKLNLRSKLDLLRCVFQLRRYIQKNKIEIVHSHLYWSNIISRMVSTRHTKVFNSIHAISSAASYDVNRNSLYLERLTYRKNHYIVAVSEEVLNDFDKWIGLKGKSTVLYNTIDDRFFAPQPKTQFSSTGLKMIAVGNLRWQKNYPFLLESFKTMPAGVSLDIYGEGELRNELQAIIDEFKLNIRLCGHRNNLYEILPEYDVFVMSSLYEGFSLGVMEAMASGLPVFLSDIPVLKEAAANCALYFSLDNPNSLVQLVERILNDRSPLAVLSGMGWERAAGITGKDGYMQKLAGLYKSH